MCIYICICIILYALYVCTHSYLHVYWNVYGHLILYEYFCNLILIYYVRIYKGCAVV